MPEPSIERELVPLLDLPHEGLTTELKDWLDLTQRAQRGNLARALIALANHGGGYVLFGFVEEINGWRPSGACPFDLKAYSADEINNIVKAHAEPTFECSTHHLHASDGSPHVVVRVPGGHTAPIRSRGAPAGSRLKDHVYYIRRNGPESAPPETGPEWTSLIERCLENNHERQVESFRRIVSALVTAPDVLASLQQLSSGAEEALEVWDASSVKRLSLLAAIPEGDNASGNP